MSKLPLEVITLVGNWLIKSAQGKPCLLLMIAATDTTRMLLRGFPKPSEVFLKELWIVHLLTVWKAQIRLKTKVNAYACTIVCLSILFRTCVCYDVNVPLVKARTFYSHLFNLTLVWSWQWELVVLLDWVNVKHVTTQGEPSLFIAEGSEVSSSL